MRNSIVTCQIGINSVVTKDCLQENGLYIGSPAKLIKENVNWDYEFPKGDIVKANACTLVPVNVLIFSIK